MAASAIWIRNDVIEEEKPVREEVIYTLPFPRENGEVIYVRVLWNSYYDGFDTPFQFYDLCLHQLYQDITLHGEPWVLVSHTSQGCPTIEDSTRESCSEDEGCEEIAKELKLLLRVNAKECSPVEDAMAKELKLLLGVDNAIDDTYQEIREHSTAANVKGPERAERAELADNKVVQETGTNYKQEQRKSEVSAWETNVKGPERAERAELADNKVVQETGTNYKQEQRKSEVSAWETNDKGPERVDKKVKEQKKQEHNVGMTCTEEEDVNTKRAREQNNVSFVNESVKDRERAERVEGEDTHKKEVRVEQKNVNKVKEQTESNHWLTKEGQSQQDLCGQTIDQGQQEVQKIKRKNRKRKSKAKHRATKGLKNVRFIAECFTIFALVLKFVRMLKSLFHKFKW